MAVLEIARFRLRDGVAAGSSSSRTCVSSWTTSAPGLGIGRVPGARRSPMTARGSLPSAGSPLRMPKRPWRRSWTLPRPRLPGSGQSELDVDGADDRDPGAGQSQGRERAGAVSGGYPRAHVREAVTANTGDRYTQHSTGVRDGVEGFVEFFDEFVVRNPKRDIQIVRAIEDGPYVFVHAFQSINGGESQWVTTDLFDTDGNDRIVEHWDVISAFTAPTGGPDAGRRGDHRHRPGADRGEQGPCPRDDPASHDRWGWHGRRRVHLRRDLPAAQHRQR